MYKVIWKKYAPTGKFILAMKFVFIIKIGFHPKISASYKSSFPAIKIRSGSEIRFRYKNSLLIKFVFVIKTGPVKKLIPAI